MTDRRVAVLDADESCPRLPLVQGAGRALAVVWPGVGANMRSMARIALETGASTVPLEHPMEAVYYVIAGSGTVRDPGNGAAGSRIAEGSMVHIDAGTRYVFASGPGGLEIIGGPCPADPRLFASIG